MNSSNSGLPPAPVNLQQAFNSSDIGSNSNPDIQQNSSDKGTCSHDQKVTRSWWPQPSTSDLKRTRAINDELMCDTGEKMADNFKISDQLHKVVRACMAYALQLGSNRAPMASITRNEAIHKLVAARISAEKDPDEELRDDSQPIVEEADEEEDHVPIPPASHLSDILMPKGIAVVSNRHTEAVRHQKTRKMLRLIKKDSPGRRPIAFAIAMQTGISVGSIDVMRKCANKGFYGGHNVLTEARKKISAQASMMQPIFETPDGCCTDPTSILRMGIERQLRRQPQISRSQIEVILPGIDKPVPPDVLSRAGGRDVRYRIHFQAKVTGDARSMLMKSDLTHTEFFLIIINKFMPSTWQSPKYTSSLALWEGDDGADKVKNNLTHIMAELERLEQDGFLAEVYLNGNKEVIHCLPEFVLAADWKTLWGYYGVGGLHDKDKMPCHYCNVTHNQRHTYLRWVHVKKDACVLQFAEQHDMWPDDLAWINLQVGKAAQSLDRHCEHAYDPRIAAIQAEIDEMKTEKKKSYKKQGSVNFIKLEKLAAQQLSLFKPPETAVFSKLQELLIFEGRHHYWKQSDAQPTCNGGDYCGEMSGCEHCTIPADTWVRVVKRDHKMDRDTCETCIGWDIPKDKCVFCAMHCIMRTTECLFRQIKTYAQNTSSVDKVNQVLTQYKVKYQIKNAVGKGKKSKRVVWKPPKFLGAEAMAVIDAVPAILRMIYGVKDGACEPANRDLRQQFHFQLRLWYNWSAVARILHKQTPSTDDLDKFPKEVTAFAVSLVTFMNKTDMTALYLHF